MLRLCTPLLKSLTVALSMVMCACFSVVSAEEVVSERARLVAEFSVFVPSNPVDCDSANPWAAGRWKLSDGGAVPSGGCLSLSYNVISEAHAVLIHQGPEGVLSRLSPSTCSLGQSDVLPKGEHWFPTSKHGRDRIIELDSEAGFERFYLVVLESGAGNLALLQQLTAIASLDSTCDQAFVGPRDMAELQAFISNSGAVVEWHTQSIEHY